MKSKNASVITKQIDSFESSIATTQTGTISMAGDGVAKVKGLSGIAMNEMLKLGDGVDGLAINLEKDSVGAIVLGDYLKLREGDEVTGTGQLLSIPVSNELMGRVIDPLGETIDGGATIKSKKRYPIEKVAPGVTERKSVDVSLATGIKAIDAMIPIGRGQRELIIGDRGVGKTAIAIDAIINQKDTGVICVYVSIGQKAARVAQLIETLREHDAMDHTIVVTANSSDPSSMQYLAPYAGSAVAEYFMDQGKDVLIVYDDLSKHAWAYRQISLVLRRPSGREAYPGDVFYLHSRLLERACRRDSAHGGGSITALPIIETLAGDLSAYIPTNVISITDGQLFLETDLFFSGIRPAISVGLSVSRVGSSAQTKAMKQVAGKMRLELAQYRSLAAFAQFSSDLDAATKSQIDRGARMTELLKQKQYTPMPMAEQVVVIWAGINGFADDVEIAKVSEFELAWLEYMRTKGAKELKSISADAKISDEVETKLRTHIAEFKKMWSN